MTPSQSLLELADKIDRYSPSGHFDIDRDRERDLDEAVGLALGAGHQRKVGDPALGNQRWVPVPHRPYMTSLDAAVTLVPKGARWILDSDGCHCRITAPGKRWPFDGFTGLATAPSRAVCSASLRARAALSNSPEENEG